MTKRTIQVSPIEAREIRLALMARVDVLFDRWQAAAIEGRTRDAKRWQAIHDRTMALKASIPGTQSLGVNGAAMFTQQDDREASTLRGAEEV